MNYDHSSRSNSWDRMLRAASPTRLTQRQGKELVRTIAASVKRMRDQMEASMLEYAGGDRGMISHVYEQLSKLQPRLFGPRSVHTLLESVADAIDPEGEDRPLDLYIFYTIVSEARRIDVVAAELLTLGVQIPKPDASWLTGWYDPQEGAGEESQLTGDDLL